MRVGSQQDSSKVASDKKLEKNEKQGRPCACFAKRIHPHTHLHDIGECGVSGFVES